MPFTCEVQPFSRIFLDAIDTGRWSRFAAVGPTQTGKSLICYVIPVLYHLFALNETVVAGIPTLNIANDKWREDFLPVIEASPELRDQLPISGEGSRGGLVKTAIKFRNGATLRFMSGGGSDKTRAGFSSRVLAVTEVDGLDDSQEKSDEADKIEQMRGRMRAHLKRGTTEYLECTASTSAGRIWQEYTGATESRLARPCPYCHEYVTPERDHLIGWEHADDELEARELAHWSCPACAALWTEDDRYRANLQSVMVHRGQEVTRDGQVHGPVPRTRTLGFRWSAVDNHFATAADMGSDLWKAASDPNQENAEKKLRQFVFALPWDPPQVDLPQIRPEAISKRVGELRRGVLPAECVGLAVGIDTGKRLLHWTAIAGTDGHRGHVCEYGKQAVESDRLGVGPALVEALRMLRGYFVWGQRKPDQVWIDCRWHEHMDAVYAFCREANKDTSPGQEAWRPCMGYGEGKESDGKYYQPKAITREIRLIGDNYHLAANKRAGQMVAHVNGDHWKARVHEQLSIPADQPNALTLFSVADPREHEEFSRHIAAEKAVPKGPDGFVFERESRANHWLDSTYYGRAALDCVLALTAKRKGRPESWCAKYQKGKR